MLGNPVAKQYTYTSPLGIFDEEDDVTVHSEKQVEDTERGEKKKKRRMKSAEQISHLEGVFRRKFYPSRQGDSYSNNKMMMIAGGGVAALVGIVAIALMRR